MQNIRRGVSLECSGFKMLLTYLEFYLLSEKQSVNFSFGRVHEL